MGGTQSLHTNSKDEALWLPTPQSVTTALRTQQIIAEETGAADSVDPLAGSYLVEYLTDEISTRALEYIKKIDAMGGALSAIERGYLQSEIQEAAYRFQKSIESGERTVVGVNKYQSSETVELERLKVDPKIELDQREKLASLRAGRDSSKVSELLTRLEKDSKTDTNLMPLLIECVEQEITLGEICRVLRGSWGEYQASSFM
jgi:methylmalonyl-CoA mutase N-terminal domain/subunit